VAIRKGIRGTKQLGDMHEKGAQGKNTRREPPRPGQKWWDLKEEQVPGALMSTIRHIQQNQTSIEQETLALSRLYGGRLPGSAYGTPHHAMRGVHPSLAGRLTYNVLAIVIDALVSKITKENLATQFITNGGDYRQQRRAKKLSQFADGVNYETKMDEKGQDAFRDATLSPLGAVHTYADWNTGRVRSERVMSHELFIDYSDGFYGDPRQMHRVKMVDREVLLETDWAKGNKDVAKAIKDCRDTGPLGYAGEYQALNDMIAVGESWHLPSGVDEDGEPSDDGRHMVYISNAILTPGEERKWKKTRFPFSFYRWKKDTEGFHGIPLGRDLIGSQVEMNHLLIMFQRAFRMMAAFRIWVESGTVPDQHFQDKIGTILHGPRGSTPPQFLTPPAMNAQYFDHFEKIKSRAFEIARLSQLSAMGEKPAGLDSGEAQRTYHDIEGEGFSSAAKAYEAFRLDVAGQQIDVVRDIFGAEKKYSLRAPVSSSTLPGHRFLRSIDWKNVKLDEDEYILRGYSTSSLPSTPAGRLATIQDMLRAGLLDPETGRRLLNFPDLAQVQSLLGAAEDWIMSCLDSIVDDGKMKRADPFMNIAMAEKLAIQEYSLGAANDMEEEKLDMLRTFISDVQRYKAKAQQASIEQQMQATAAATGQPMGVGAPAQQSPMLPPNGMQGAI
jgi:hypothetical protein